MNMNKRKLTLLALVAISQSAFAATPKDWVTTINATTTGSVGTITFNDWGYTGPTGVGANDYQVGSGFNASRIGQVQHVVTKLPDGKTTDAPATVLSDNFYVPHTYSNANMDGQTNFFGWAYTSPAGSTFNNMQIDKAGNYHIARSDMNFNYYDKFLYQDMTGSNKGTSTYDSTNNTFISFQPYAVSDAKGWCGSVLTANSNGLEKMAGQVTFDFAFDAYLFGAKPGPGVTPATQIVPGFVMRSYGSYDVNVTTNSGNVGGFNQHFTGSAVMNNTDPLTGKLDPAYQNEVSFLGAGVVPKGVWVFNNNNPATMTVAADQSTLGTADGQVRVSDGATWHNNAFGGYAFLLRADANRTLDIIGIGSPTDPSNNYVANRASWTDYAAPAAVPLPAASWLMGSGLLGLVGVARRRKVA